ncbi:uncharacterized protein LOC110924177 [Helianthus annuus]|uniref:uncharacterized protein LOC110924177 n=1 Tax=Helianthus annuus TaxID=4232 RepID=UPI000B900B1D|nr:uncharacterized protein LOC110924177 [Helianthus annuus]
MNFISLNVRGVRGGVKAGWVRDLKFKSGASFIALQETMVLGISTSSMTGFWGNFKFELESVDATGTSGGLVSMWDPSMFKLGNSVKDRNFIYLSGKLVGSGETINIFNIYAPQSTSAKLRLWEALSALILSAEGMCLLMGDFNAVRLVEERKNSCFNPVCARNFNDFIFSCGLLEYNMQGRRFTCSRDNGKKLSKIDRVLVCAEFFNKWPNACLRAHPCVFSDQCPLSLEVVDVNFGPRPFRIFTSWIGQSGFEEAVLEAVVGGDPNDPPDIALSKKFFSYSQKVKKLEG